MNLHIIHANIIWANIIVSIKSFYREKTVVFFRLAFPVILILVFGTIFMERDNEIFDLSVQDLDQTTSSEQLVESIHLSKRFKITKVSPAADAQTYAKINKLNLIVIIPKDFEMSLMQKMESNNSDTPVNNTNTFGTPVNITNTFGTPVNLTKLYDPSSFGVTTKIGVLDMVLAGINQEMSGKPPLIVSKPLSILKKKYRFIEFFVPGIIAMAVMTASLFGAVNVNAELRQKGVIRKLCTTPITRIDWILSNVFYQFILAVLSTVVMLLVSYVVFDVNLEINGWLVVFVALDVFSFVGLGMILTRVAKEAESAAASADALMFPMMFLSGTFFPVEMMPEFLQKFAKVLPLYYVNEGLRAAMVSVDHTAALKCALIIGAFAAVVFVLGIMITTMDGET
ncbi:MAG: ABC transporter permease, partial [Desulfamplus sp.]|nr:ABC transporter permease [Desulfamplus sp.]